MSEIVKGFDDPSQSDGFDQRLEALKRMAVEDDGLAQVRDACVRGYSAMRDAQRLHQDASQVVQALEASGEAPSIAVREATEAKVAAASRAIAKSRKWVTRCHGDLSELRLKHPFRSGASE